MTDQVEQDWQPDTHKRMLAQILRDLREAAHMTRAAVEEKTWYDSAKIMRMEAGKVSVNPADVDKLLNVYEVAEDKREEIRRIAILARAKSPLDQYKKYVSPQFFSYLSDEHSASHIRNFECTLIPGLLQAPNYADAVLKHIRGLQSPTDIQKLVNLRLDRQKRLLDEDGLQLSFILDESILHRTVGGGDVMAHQLSHLQTLFGRPNLDIRVIPFSAGVYRSVRVPFVVLDFPNPEKAPVLFLEYPQGDQIIQGDAGEELGPAKVRTERVAPSTYLEIYFELEQLATPEKSLDLITGALREI